MKNQLIFYLILFMNISCIQGMEEPSTEKKIKRQSSATELLQRITPAPLRRTLSGNAINHQWVNKELNEITHDYKQDAENAIFDKDPVKFSAALEKIGDPKDRVDLTRRWNLLRGQKVSAGRFDINQGGSLLVHHKRLEQNGKNPPQP